MHEPALPTARETPHGETSASTEAAGGHGPTGGPLLDLSAEGWVYVGLTLFFLLAIFVGKAPQWIATKLDARIAEVRRQLDEARAIRAEAETMLADANRLRSEAAANASTILAGAETEAAALVAKAEADARTLIERRTRMAEDKIGAAERSAVAEVRQRAVDVSARAAARLIAERHDASADRAMIDGAIAGLGRAR